MGEFLPTRDEAWTLLCEWTSSPGLRAHALAVEAAMRFYARNSGESEEYWGNVGLLHDFDYERYPDAADHPLKGAEELRRRGYDESFVRAVLSHADYLGLARNTNAEKTLVAVDELCGLIMATAMVMPGRSLAEVTAEAVLKKMKSKGFARKVNREDIVRGTEGLGIPLETHVSNVVRALQGIAATLGL